mmetsp:Transcript_87396/g.138772  ORF Transcript_87396/g.138772 Transcript_87396/m.138772 type:complete len:86 (+) Transcript_87396:46-303(+)
MSPAVSQELYGKPRKRNPEAQAFQIHKILDPSQTRRGAYALSGFIMIYPPEFGGLSRIFINFSLSLVIFRPAWLMGLFCPPQASS